VARTVEEQRGLAWVRDISWHADLSFNNNCDQLDSHGASSEQNRAQQTTKRHPRDLIGQK